MARPMTYPMGTMAVGDVVTIPITDKGDSKRISRNVSQYGIRNGKCFTCRTLGGLTYIMRLR